MDELDTKANTDVYEEEKARLELEKLRLEVRQMSSHWWSRPVYIAALSPLAIAILAFSSAWLSGWFDKQRIELAASKAALETQVKKLSAERVQLKAEVDGLNKSVEKQKSVAMAMARAYLPLCRQELARLTKAAKEAHGSASVKVPQAPEYTFALSTCVAVMGFGAMYGKQSWAEISPEASHAPNPAASADQKAPLSGR